MILCGQREASCTGVAASRVSPPRYGGDLAGYWSYLIGQRFECPPEVRDWPVLPKAISLTPERIEALKRSLK